MYGKARFDTFTEKNVSSRASHFSVFRRTLYFPLASALLARPLLYPMSLFTDRKTAGNSPGRKPEKHPRIFNRSGKVAASPPLCSSKCHLQYPFHIPVDTFHMLHITLMLEQMLVSYHLSFVFVVSYMLKKLYRPILTNFLPRVGVFQRAFSAASGVFKTQFLP